MTSDNARTILAVPRTAKKKSIEQAYKKRCKELQIKIRPGNPITVRKQAQAQLVQVTAAWNMLNQKPVKRSTKSTPKPQRMPRVTWHPTSYSGGPLNLGTVWKKFFSLIPLPEPVVIIISVLVTLGLFTLLMTKGDILWDYFKTLLSVR